MQQTNNFICDTDYTEWGKLKFYAGGLTVDWFWEIVINSASRCTLGNNRSAILQRLWFVSLRFWRYINLFVYAYVCIAACTCRRKVYIRFIVECSCRVADCIAVFERMLSDCDREWSVYIIYIHQCFVAACNGALSPSADLQVIALLLHVASTRRLAGLRFSSIVQACRVCHLIAVSSERRSWNNHPPFVLSASSRPITRSLIIDGVSRSREKPCRACSSYITTQENYYYYWTYLIP